MANKPSQITLRAYDVGFGDCFLLSFKYAQRSKHVLIDFGSTRAPTGKTGSGPYMERIAKQIATDCGGALTAVVATHRHKDHVSGFARNGDKGPGAIIRALRPNIVIQPWTEHPRAVVDAREPPAAIRNVAGRRHAYLYNLHQMNRFADYARSASRRLAGSHLQAVRDQVDFLGDDNGLANRSAVTNLMTMGQRSAKYVHAGANAGLGALLPGVKVHVLGPPTLKQEPRIASQTDTEANEFWHLRAGFWARRGALGSKPATSLKHPLFPKQVLDGIPWDVRWYRYRAQIEQAESLLSIVRTLDDAMNNTSVILLFEIGNTCLLFPGDAQWENWRFALSQPKYQALLKRVTLYKVGHHGSLNATPMSLWNAFEHRGGPSMPQRLMSVLSTKNDVHGSEDRRTEVPRKRLVTALKKDSTLIDTRDTAPTELARVHTITL